MKDIDDLLLSRTTSFTFNALHTLLCASGLDVDLQSYAGNITLFAPPDEALERLKEKTPFDLMKDIQNLRRLLSFHMVPLRLTQANLHSLLQQAQPATTPTLELETISGYPLHVTQSESLMVEDASVLAVELIADNGIAHVIDHVLWPPGLHEGSFHSNVPFHTSA
ncbi:fasciclin domain-containing protein [Dictyobacter formicarum]|uniref:FAS1 domain-containing protein n=1 Tax=Dictyobacter formicarum TaxID=2778368 RepID=A0ABQ3VDV5_9CHLR|nr:fasciclin domain-containing protein [Dictyobacter formicarum]GHO83843.1 hypothetical protein KSZ_18490 [Dictyobacter formicarum]